MNFQDDIRVLIKKDAQNNFLWGQLLVPGKKPVEKTNEKEFFELLGSKEAIPGWGPSGMAHIEVMWPKEKS